MKDQIDFDSIKIFDNQIRFYGTKSRLDSTKYPSKEESFPTGEAIVQTDSGYVTKITIDKQYKSMNFSRIDEYGKRLYNQPEILINTYELIPRTRVKSLSLGDIGIFKNCPVIIKRK